MKEAPSLNNRILPFIAASHQDTIETTLEHVEDGLGRIHVVQDDMMHLSEGYMTPKISVIGPGDHLKDSVSYNDEDISIISNYGIGRILFYQILLIG